MYKELLKEMQEKKLNGSDYAIADEVQFQLDNFYDEETGESKELPHTDEDFEKLCRIVKDAYLDGDYNNIWALSIATVELFNRHSIDEIDIWTVIDNAVCLGG